MIFVSVRYWIEFGREERRGAGKQDIPYNKFFLTLMAIGFFGIWPFWVGCIVFLFMNCHYTVFDFITFSSPMASFLQVVGLVIFYSGSSFLTWALDFAGKYLRPSTSGVYAEHKLVQNGPLGIMRHPYYVSYVLILVGLSLTLTMLWPLVPALCVVIGMGPTAKAEEEQLAARSGEEYRRYQQRVGRFFPKLFR
jgi:protein-S-isoprenylcysteine O-methyltransferase Ste14